jgi:hypothetical protein
VASDLEVTESTILSGGEKVQQVLRNLHGAGLSLWTVAQGDFMAA